MLHIYSYDLSLVSIWSLRYWNQKYIFKRENLGWREMFNLPDQLDTYHDFLFP